eukprot:364480-Chlamydomonas_euryale.AAC.9
MQNIYVREFSLLVAAGCCRQLMNSLDHRKTWRAMQSDDPTRQTRKRPTIARCGGCGHGMSGGGNKQASIRLRH